jgi:hypothetical protein
MMQYKVGRSTITKILEYKALERSRVSRTSRSSFLTSAGNNMPILFFLSFYCNKYAKSDIMK